MTIYIARIIDDKQIVGIFSVQSDDELFWLIDECCNPYEVEIAKLPTGGIYWRESLEFSVPVSDAILDSENYDGLPGGASVSSGWDDVILGDESKAVWQKVPSKPDPYVN